MTPHDPTDTERDAWTADAIFGGRVPVLQPRRGYRFNIDSLLLAAFAARRSPERILDVGAGCGVILIAMGTLLPSARGVAVEVQDELLPMLRTNLAEALPERPFEAVGGDIRTLGRRLPHQAWDAVVMNPPYFGPGRATGPTPTRAASRHQLHGDIGELIAALRPFPDHRGTIELVYPTAGLSRVLRALEDIGFRHHTIRLVADTIAAPPHLALIRARRARTMATELLPTLALRDAAGGWTPEVDQILVPPLPDTLPEPP